MAIRLGGHRYHLDGLADPLQPFETRLASGIPTAEIITMSLEATTYDPLRKMDEEAQVELAVDATSGKMSKWVFRGISGFLVLGAVAMVCFLKFSPSPQKQADILALQGKSPYMLPDGTMGGTDWPGYNGGGDDLEDRIWPGGAGTSGGGVYDPPCAWTKRGCRGKRGDGFGYTGQDEDGNVYAGGGFLPPTPKRGGGFGYTGQDEDGNVYAGGGFLPPTPKRGGGFGYTGQDEDGNVYAGGGFLPPTPKRGGGFGYTGQDEDGNVYAAGGFLPGEK